MILNLNSKSLCIKAFEVEAEYIKVTFHNGLSYSFSRNAVTKIDVQHASITLTFLNSIRAEMIYHYMKKCADTFIPKDSTDAEE
jgi:hypothetical protein